MGGFELAADYKWKTRDPLNPMGDPIEVIFPASLTEKWYKEQPIRYENLRAAKFVLDNVQRIFSGTRRLNDGFWCYTVRPTEWYIKEKVIAPFPNHLVFAVCLDTRMRVYDCRGEFASDDDKLCPKNWRGRYKGLVWKSTF